MLNGNIGHIRSSTNTWHSAHQQRPNEDTWKLWRGANSLWSDADGKLYQPLTKWLSPPSRQRRLWPVYADHEQNLYAIADNPNELVPHQRRYRVRQWHAVSESGQPVLLEDSPNAAGLVPYTANIPDHATPVAVETDQQGNLRLAFTWRMIINQSFRNTNVSHARVQEDFQKYLQQLEEWELSC